MSFRRYSAVLAWNIGDGTILSWQGKTGFVYPLLRDSTKPISASRNADINRGVYACTLASRRDVTLVLLEELLGASTHGDKQDSQAALPSIRRQAGVAFHVNIDGFVRTHAQSEGVKLAVPVYTCISRATPGNDLRRCRV